MLHGCQTFRIDPKLQTVINLVTQGIHSIHSPFYYSRRSNGWVNKRGLTVSNFRLMQTTKRQGIRKFLAYCTLLSNNQYHSSGKGLVVRLHPTDARKAPRIRWKTCHFAPSFFSNVFASVTEEHHSKSGNQGFPCFTGNSMLASERVIKLDKRSI
ncbi:hypothetical protein L873DRAFT_786448 [Choiromyces venosus 120613-1]|uniref:Uncharacterized protein n=1 Tax=Choiromyces venosus 120613-1 TaxID=1336337 RepID=A0A3N4K4R7_9PEZI|nr:hypothetical protein L873DRAFT_786448 [Choiromyces venosus 120613-1]